MPLAQLPTLNAAWRPNATGPAPKTRDDRSLIRSYWGAPATQAALHDLTVAMNRLATIDPASVAQIQAWINEVEDLELAWADQVSSGTAQVSEAMEYEGPVPGTTFSRKETLKRADVLEWDTSLNKVKFKMAPGSSPGSAINGRIALLKGKVLKALALEGAESGRLLRS